MGCGCRKNRTTTVSSNSSSPSFRYEVYLNGVPTGRKFTSLASAQTYAARIGGTVQNT